MWAGLYVLAICAPISAPAQTPGSEVRARQSPSGEPNARLAGVDGCSGASRPAERGAIERAGASGAISGCLNARDHDQLARRFVDETLAMWRHRLNLEQWDISVVMTRRSDLKAKTRGQIRWDKGKKSAVIRVLDASDYQLPLREMLDDMEFTIVHELLHLELASLPRSEASRRSEEHAVNSITAALLRLARQQ
jgi:hypothetical protein